MQLLDFFVLTFLGCSLIVWSLLYSYCLPLVTDVAFLVFTVHALLSDAMGYGTHGNANAPQIWNYSFVLAIRIDSINSIAWIV